MTRGTSPGEPKAPGDAFRDSDLTWLWIDGDFSSEYHEESSPSDELIASVEADLGGYKLPTSYVELARIHNAVGRTAQWSLVGPL